MKRRRDEWREQQPRLNPRDLVFIDETWATTNLTRRYGRAPRGERLVCRAPHGHWKTITFTAALSLAGLNAPMTLDGAMNRACFVAYVQQVLVPTLRVGQIVVLDNLQSHLGPPVRRLIEAAGCRLEYLPPYSPDFNPIEQAFSKLKALLRRAVKRTIPDLEKFLGRVHKLFTRRECRNYFRNSGYCGTQTSKPL